MKISPILFSFITGSIVTNVYSFQAPSHYQRIASQLRSTEHPTNDLIPEFLAGSSLIYSYAAIREIVNEHDREVRKGVPAKENVLPFGMFGIKKEKDLIDFTDPALVVTQNSAHVNNRGRYLKHDITAPAVLEFIRRNRKYLSDEAGHITLEENNGDPLKVEATLEQDCTRDIHLVEFDDKFEMKELVFGITVNKTDKRIAVFFRGSVTGQDWKTDLQAWFSKYETPECLKDDLQEDEEIRMHSGFYKYLFGPNKEEDNQPKIKQIVNDLKEIYEQYPGYDLYISGHSLGAALAQLLAFAVAADEECKEFVPSPITAISFASPTAGDTTYGKAFETLEEEGRLRHLRITNEADIVPVGLCVGGYCQTGVNFHVKPGKKMSFGYGRSPNVFTFLNQAMKLNAVVAHSLAQYKQHTFIDANRDVLSKSINTLYYELA